MNSFFNYGRNKEKLMYSFLNFRRNEEKWMYSFFNYRWFDIANIDNFEVVCMVHEKLVCKAWQWNNLPWLYKCSFRSLKFRTFWYIKNIGLNFLSQDRAQWPKKKLKSSYVGQEPSRHEVVAWLLNSRFWFWNRFLVP
jgi:hypothetical protein